MLRDMPQRKPLNPTLAPPAPPPSPARSFTARAVLLACVLVCIVAAVTPYNDYVVGNSFLIGSFLPTIVVLMFVMLVPLANALLHRFAPTRAFSSGELAVIMLMLLVACSIPAQGLLRSFLPSLVAPFRAGELQPQFWTQFSQMNLPAWLFPVGEVAQGRGSDVVAWFYARTPDGNSPPYGTWLLPIGVWSIFFVAMFAALLAIAGIFYPQWAHNERLPFPLAELQLQMIESPPPGRAFNALFSSRGFWFATIGVMLIHSLTMLNEYFPKSVPTVPTAYNFQTLMSEAPFSYLSRYIKENQIFFTFVGIMYFVPSRIGFSITVAYVGIQLLSMQQQIAGRPPISKEMLEDQHLGAAVAWVITFCWIGRSHIAKVCRHLFRGARAEELQSMRGLAITLILSIAVMTAWLSLAGVSIWMTLIILSTMLIAHIVVARLVAETGIPILRSVASPDQIYQQLPVRAFSDKDIFFAGAFHSLGAYTTRESVLTFAQHGERNVEQNTSHVSAWKYVGAIVLALVLSMGVGTASSLHAYYNFAVPLNAGAADTMLNRHGAETLPKTVTIDPVIRHAGGSYAATPHTPVAQFGVGAALVLLLQFLTVRFSGWPLPAVGYIFATTPFVVWAWFSVMLGWLAKVVVVRLGGVSLYRTARPVFVGLIFGESLAVGLWIVISLVLAALGMDFKPVRFLTF